MKIDLTTPKGPITVQPNLGDPTNEQVTILINGVPVTHVQYNPKTLKFECSVFEADGQSVSKLTTIDPADTPTSPDEKSTQQKKQLAVLSERNFLLEKYALIKNESPSAVYAGASKGLVCLYVGLVSNIIQNVLDDMKIPNGVETCMKNNQTVSSLYELRHFFATNFPNIVHNFSNDIWITDTRALDEKYDVRSGQLTNRQAIETSIKTGYTREQIIAVTKRPTLK